MSEVRKPRLLVRTPGATLRAQKPPDTVAWVVPPGLPPRLQAGTAHPTPSDVETEEAPRRGSA